MKDANTRKLLASGVPFRSTNEGRTLVLRELWVAADFYPATGNWKDVGAGGVIHEHEDFFDWLKHKKEEHARAEKQREALRRVRGRGLRRRTYTHHSQQK